MWLQYHRHHKPPLRPEAVAEAHPCPVPDCTALCSPGHVVCRLHWRGIPQEERVPLIAAFHRREADPVSFALACDVTRALAVQYARVAACAVNAR